MRVVASSATATTAPMTGIDDADDDNSERDKPETNRASKGKAVWGLGGLLQLRVQSPSRRRSTMSLDKIIT